MAGRPPKEKRHLIGKGNGEQRRYFEAIVLPYDGDGCLTWPYSLLNTGYAVLNKKVVSRLACEHRNGPPPHKSCDAAHSCGNGHLGCVNPNHLSWKTRKDNMADQLVHGTRNRGTRQGHSKLTPEVVMEIRDKRGKKTQAAIAQEYGLSAGHVSNIMNGKKSWEWLDGRQAS